MLGFSSDVTVAEAIVTKLQVKVILHFGRAEKFYVNEMINKLRVESCVEDWRITDKQEVQVEA